MTTPTITPTPSPLPNRSQDKTAFNNAVDTYMTWLEANADELNILIPWIVQSRDEVIAAALAGNLPSLAGFGGQIVVVSPAEDGVVFAPLFEVPSFAGNAGKPVVVKGTEDGIEYGDFKSGDIDGGAITDAGPNIISGIPSNAKSVQIFIDRVYGTSTSLVELSFNAGVGVAPTVSRFGASSSTSTETDSTTTVSLDIGGSVGTSGVVNLERILDSNNWLISGQVGGNLFGAVAGRIELSAALSSVGLFGVAGNLADQGTFTARWWV